MAVEQAPRSELDVDGHRIRAAAFGVGVSFVGAALIVAAVTGSVWATLAVLIAGAVTTSSVHRRHRRHAPHPSQPAPRAVEAVKQAIIDLRAEAEATDSALRRAAERRTSVSASSR